MVSLEPSITQFSPGFGFFISTKKVHTGSNHIVAFGLQFASLTNTIFVESDDWRWVAHRLAIEQHGLALAGVHTCRRMVVPIGGG